MDYSLKVVNKFSYVLVHVYLLCKVEKKVKKPVQQKRYLLALAFFFSIVWKGMLACRVRGGWEDSILGSGETAESADSFRPVRIKILIQK
jgi:hypothetical protein